MLGLSIGQIEEAAELLMRARVNRQLLASLPDAIRPQTNADAHAIQDAVRRRRGEDIAAIKVTAVRPGVVSRGMLSSAACKASPATVDAYDGQFAGIEAEIAFQFPEGLAPSSNGYDAAIVSEQAEACVAFDIVGTRFENFMSLTSFERIADGLNAGAFVHGGCTRDWTRTDFARLPVKVWIDGAEAFSGHGGHPAGGPFAPVLAYVDTVRDAGLPPGMIITTGSFCGLLPVKPGQTISAQLGSFDPVEVTLRAADKQEGYRGPDSLTGTDA